MKKLLLLLGLACFTFPGNKIVYIIAPPRSLSTVFFRMFENRKDFTGFMEPSIAVQWSEDIPGPAVSIFREDAFKTKEEINQTIFEKQQKSHVVVKDVVVSPSDIEWVGSEYTNNSDVHFVFLVRHPYQILRSLYIGNGMVHKDFYHAAGLEYLWGSYHRIKSQSLNKVHLLYVDDLLKDPKGEMEKIFSSIGLPLTEESLSLKNLGDSFSGDSWHVQAHPEHFQKWHGTASKSTRLKPYKEWLLPLDDCLYSEIENEDDREMMIRFYKHHLSYFNRFMEEKK